MAKTRIVLLSAAGQKGDAARCRQLGIAGYLTKPVQRAEFLDVFLAVLEGPEPGTEPSPLATRHSTRENARELRILVGEGSPEDPRGAAAILRRGGHSIVTAENGWQILDELAGEPFDIVLLEARMPVMDGAETIEAIRDREGNTRQPMPVVVMGAEGDREVCMGVGADAFVGLPLQEEELLRVVLSVSPTPGEAEVKSLDATRTADQVFDRKKCLSHLGGKEELLRSVINLFFHESPGMMEEIERAVQLRNADGVSLSTHTLKGTLSVLGAKEAHAAAARLADLGQSGDLSEADRVFSELEWEVKRLTRTLIPFAKEPAE